MNKEYVDKEVDKIFKNSEFAYPLNVAMSCIWMLANQKGSNLKILQLENLTALADYFVLASAQNPVQAESMADDLYLQLKKQGVAIKSREGSKESDWILLDLGNIIVHIFLESSRNVYDLDELWKKAPLVNIPQSYYFQFPEEQSAQSGVQQKPDSIDRYY